MGAAAPLIANAMCSECGKCGHGRPYCFALCAGSVPLQESAEKATGFSHVDESV